MRKLATAAAVSLALASGGAFGLGLGDIEMQSALNQPMNAEIQLTSVKPGELEGMIVQLASEDAFARAGIERADALTDLTFTVDDSSGTPVIRISSSRPVVEPFLNFLLEVDWPQGRMVREYTVLLDPPVFMTPSATERNSASDQPTIVERGEDTGLVPTPIQRGEVELLDENAEGIVVDLDSLLVDEDLVEGASAAQEVSPTPGELLGESSTGSDGGELISLDELADEELLSQNDPAVGDDSGEIVSLTDLTAPNTDAIAQRESLAVETFSLDDIQVELSGSDQEITDDVIVDAAGEIVRTTDESGEATGLADIDLDDDSTIVSLDELEEQLGDLGSSVEPAVIDAEEVENLADQVAAVEDAAEESAAESAVDTAGETAREVTVNAGDTLFEIAERNPISGVSVQQMMMAMLTTNESSFINNNINLVRAGSILRVPDETEANKLTQAEAIAAISDQQQLWQEYRDNLRNAGATQIAQNIPQEAPEASAPETDSADLAQQTGEDAAQPAAGTDQPLETAAIDALDLSGADGLSPEAREILENAREELLNREELKIVADNAPSSTAASATADETTDNDAARLGEVNRKLQLAREELASSRLRGEDLGEQVSELQSTSENLDALVALRQDEVARLEAQIVQAREAEAAEAARLAEEQALEAEAAEAAQLAEEEAERVAALEAEAQSEAAAAAEEAARVAEQEAADAARLAEEEAAEATRLAEEEAAEAARLAEEEAARLAEQAEALVSDARQTAETAADSAGNALTEAGETLEQVELIDGDEDTVAQNAAGAEVDTSSADEAAPISSASGNTWYQDFLQDPKRLMIAGIGALGLLGVLGTLLFRRKRRDDEPESMLDVADEAAFAEVAAAPAAESTDAGSSGFRDVAAVAAAGGAVAAGGAALAKGDNDDDDVPLVTEALHDKTLSNTVNESEDGTLSFAAAPDVGEVSDADESGEEEINQDDTLAEVDVYLAYGLHGQAEELLSKAVDSNPENPEYAHKLLQTYHAQGNSSGFHTLAQQYHARFGGEENAEWPGIAAMGQSLKPGDALYSSAKVAVSAVGVGHAASSALDEGDFAEVGSQAVVGDGSFSRDFESASMEADVFDLSGDQSGLMDQSIDPAFAFDEGDLEATGDFSRITSELAAEEGAGIDFPGFDDGGTAANETLQADDSLNTRANQLEQALNMDDGLAESVDDLTLDLDQLSGDLELDSADLLNADLNDLEIPELTADDELLLDSTSAIGEGGDEMDTMMDLAKAYIDMGDKDSASSALGEIVKSGSPEQVTEAETLLRKIS